MIKNIKKYLSLVLVLACALSLAACGTAPAQEKPAAQESSAPAAETPAEETYVWSASFKDIDAGNYQYLDVRAYTQDGFYAIVSQPAEPREGESSEETQYENLIVYADNNGVITPLEKYEPSQPEEDTEGKYEYESGCYPGYLAVKSTGEIVLLENFYANWAKTENVSRDSEEYWNNYSYEQKYYLRILNPDGSEIKSVEIPIGEDEYLSTVVLGKDDSIFCAGGNKIYAYSADAEALYTMETEQYAENLTAMPGGKLFLTSWGDNGEMFYPVDTENKTVGEGIRLPDGAYTLYPGGGDYPLYYSSGTGFYGFDPETGASEKIFSWANLDVASSVYSTVRIAEDGTVSGLCDESTYTDGVVNPVYKFFEVRKVPASSLPEKKSIVLATQWLDYEVGKSVIAFNRANKEYHIDIHDYSEYNTEEDYNAGITKLQTEIMAGNAPDLIDLNSLPASRLASKGLLEDLYPWLEKDSELSKDQFFENILKACEQDGKLVSTIPGFSVSTLTGASSVVGDTPGWTYQEFDAALASMPEGCEPLSAYTTRSDILRTCFGMDLEKYVNWETGACNFDNADFAALLRFAARFPTDYNWEEYDYADESDEARLASGRQMLSSTWVSSPDDVMFAGYSFGGQPYTFIGYPTNSGVGSYLSVNSGFAMSSSCTEKETAWQFLRTFFTEEYQKSIYALPVNKAAYQAKLEQAMQMQYEKDAGGNFILDENGEKKPLARMVFVDTLGKENKYYALSQEEADKLTELVTGTTRTLSQDESIFSIVEEQSEAFFQGQKSAEEVARLIQSKVNIYVNEQR